MPYDFIRLGSEGSSYPALLDSWRSETEALGEDFESYSAIPVSVFGQVLAQDSTNTGLYVARASDGSYGAVCMVNHASIPNYDGPVVRVRHIMLSPRFDLGDVPIDEYVEVLFAILNGVIERSNTDDNLLANHIKFHARSPADMSYFTALGRALDGARMFASVQMKGTWLYITKF